MSVKAEQIVRKVTLDCYESVEGAIETIEKLSVAEYLAEPELKKTLENLKRFRAIMREPKFDMICRGNAMNAALQMDQVSTSPIQNDWSSLVQDEDGDEDLDLVDKTDPITDDELEMLGGGNPPGNS